MPFSNFIKCEKTGIVPVASIFSAWIAKSCEHQHDGCEPASVSGRGHAPDTPCRLLPAVFCSGLFALCYFVLIFVLHAATR